MKLIPEKNKALDLYILQKIDQGDDAIAKSVADAIDIDQATVHAHINRLIVDGVIERVKRGSYRIVDEEYTYHLDRDKAELEYDTDVYHECLFEHVKDLPENVRRIWEYTFSEMVNNVIDHSKSSTATVKVLKNRLYTCVLLADDGIGIFQNIKDYFKYDSVDDAISELFKGKLTTNPQNHSGEGIFFSSRMMDEFWIFSQDRVFAHDRYDTSAISALGKQNITGTSVFMQISNNSQRTVTEVFDKFADAGGEFDKTSIELKNIFESAPVSRSQAKRLCNRLDIFKEVEFDFDGIDWMGQGFAHQIFVVFQKEHPDINIRPINMCDEVRKMYVHVMS